MRLVGKWSAAVEKLTLCLFVRSMALFGDCIVSLRRLSFSR